MNSTKHVFIDYIKREGLSLTAQREVILDTFLENELHFSLEELYGKVRLKNSKIGRATVYRMLKLMCEAGIANEVEFGDGCTRYEHRYGHRLHVHLVCSECGTFYEVFDEDIKRLRDKLAERYDFRPLNSKFKILGICKRCSRKAGAKIEK